MTLRVALRMVLLGLWVGVVPSSHPAAVAEESPPEVSAVALRNWPPHYVTDPQTGEPSGFAIDVMNRVAESSGIAVRYVVCDSWPEALEALERGRALVAPNLGITPERRAFCDFTTPYETFRIGIFARTATIRVRTIDDLAGKTVGVVRKNQGAVLMRERGAAELAVFDSVEEAFMALLSGNVDALVYPERPVLEIAKRTGLGDRIRVVGPPLREIKRAVAVRKGEPELFRKLDAAVRRIVPSEDFERIYQKWHGTPEPFWTVRRMVVLTALLLGLTVVAMLAWRYVTVMRLNRSLAEAESRFRRIVESSRAGYFFIDRSGRFRQVNRAWLEIHGYESADEVIGEPFAPTRAETEGEDEAPDAETLLGGHAIPTGEFAHRRRDGRIGYHTLSGHPVVHGGRVVGFEGFIIDANERKRAERALRESEEKHRLLFDNAGDAIFIHDEETRILVANPRAGELLGHAPEALTALTLDALRAAEDVPYTPERIARLMADGRLTFETAYRHKDGTSIPVEITARRIVWDGRPAILTVCRDVAARKRAEEQARHAQKVESLSRMAGAVAHHFNNQLGVVIGNLDLFLADAPVDAANRSCLDEAMRGARKAAEISGLMLTYLGQGVGETRPVDLSEACRRNLPILRSTLPAQIALETNFRASGPVVAADANQLPMLLVHLVANAAEAIGTRQGTVAIATRTLPPAELAEMSVTPRDWQPPEDSLACLEVADTGCGIDGADMDNLFDPFFTTKFTGRGLGLPVVLGLVKAWGGAVGVERRTGGGAVFRVVLPMLETSLPAVRDPAVPLPGMVEGSVAMLVDDHEMVRRMGETMLRRLGYSPVVAESGTEACRLFRERGDEIRCVITDLTMPGMDGWETLEALRRMRPGLPIVLASGYDKAQAMKTDATERPNAFLHKPYSMDELERALADALAERGGGETPSTG